MLFQDLINIFPTSIVRQMTHISLCLEQFLEILLGPELYIYICKFLHQALIIWKSLTFSFHSKLRYIGKSDLNKMYICYELTWEHELFTDAPFICLIGKQNIYRIAKTCPVLET